MSRRCHTPLALAARTLKHALVAATLTLLAAAPGFATPADPKSELKSGLAEVESALDAWDIPQARAKLDELRRTLPDVEPVNYYDGRIAFEEGRYDDAVKSFEAAGIEDSPTSYLRLARNTQQVVGDHQTIESEHFIFYFPKGKDEVLGPYALEALEQIRAALEQDLGYAPPGKIRVEVVNNAAELAKVSTLTADQIRKTGTIAICKFNKLMVTSPKAVLRGYDWLDTLAHEYVHLVVTQKSRNTVPIWLHEGIAKYLETRWRGKAGLAMSPSMLALLGDRVRKDKLIPFEKMHPSIALLPTAEDAATAFAEVYFAIDLIHRDQGPAGLRTIIDQLKAGKDDKKAVEIATGKSFPGFEKAWLAHVRKQNFPPELLPLTDEKKVLAEDTPGKANEKKNKKEISFGDFAEVQELPARKFAHLGELMRERNRAGAAAAEFAKAHEIVGDKYDSISNKYALTLLELRRFEDAEKVLQGSLRVHPGIPATYVHLGRIHLFRNDMARAKSAYLEALASDPFDAEIHLALVRIHGALGDSKLQERARKATTLLTGWPAEQVDAAAKQFGVDAGSLAEAPDAEVQSAPAAEAAADAAAQPGTKVGGPKPATQPPPDGRAR